MAEGLTWDEAALEGFLGAVAGGVDDWAQQEAAPAVIARAPHKTNRYRRSIHATTFFRGQLVGGPAIRGKRVQSKAEIWTFIYTTSTLGHLLEAGTQPHEITRKNRTVSGDRVRGGFTARRIFHPGSRPFPHFAPGILSTRGRIALSVRNGVQRRLGIR